MPGVMPREHVIHMTVKFYWKLLPLFMLIGAVYVWWTQPIFGPDSAASTITRGCILLGWLIAFPTLMRANIERWTWKYFLVGFLCGGGWLSLTFPGAETLENSFSLVALGIVVGSISGLYSAVCTSALRALGTGFALFLAQMLVNIGALAVGLSEFRYGM
jgi:hypothetical protein